MKWLLGLIIVMIFGITASAQGKVVNVYAWSAEIPETAIRQFEQETGIKVNLSTYENNEVMYSKLRANKNAGYDLVMPSSYFVDRMRRQGMLEILDKSKLSNWNNLNPALLHASYDPTSDYSMPHLWGITGIFYNHNEYPVNSITRWADLWNKRYHDQIMMLDDTREAFSMALLSLGYPANDSNPEHIKAAFLKLKALMKNVKVFSSDSIVSILIDEDASIGMAWNGDAYKASIENPNINFVYPAEGFVIWVDTFAMPKNAPHKDAAYAFLNFMLRANIAKQVANYTSFPIANLAGQKLLPESVRNNPNIYPSPAILKRGQFQTDLSDDTLALYEKYWEELKMGG